MPMPMPVRRTAHVRDVDCDLSQTHRRLAETGRHAAIGPLPLSTPCRHPIGPPRPGKSKIERGQILKFERGHFSRNWSLAPTTDKAALSSPARRSPRSTSGFRRALPDYPCGSRPGQPACAGVTGCQDRGQVAFIRCSCAAEGRRDGSDSATIIASVQAPFVTTIDGIVIDRTSRRQTAVT